MPSVSECPQTVCSRIFHSGEREGSDKTALIDPIDGSRLTYTDLEARVNHLAGAFYPNSTVAIVLPNSFHFVLIFLAVLRAGATAAPLNTKYTESEFDFYIADVKAECVVVSAKDGKQKEHAAIQASKKLKGMRQLACHDAPGYALSDLTTDTELDLDSNASRLIKSSAIAPDQTALLLHTSGTTGKPKLVPLLHRNLVIGAENVARTLQLKPGPGSCALQVFFHIHGIQAALLAPLFTAGFIVIPPSVDAASIWFHFKKYGCRWLTATPSILQVLLAAPMPDDGDVEIDFLRSCSSPLLPSTHSALEKRFRCPVIEAYAMTEAAHQMTSNTFDERISGSIGYAAGSVDVAVFGEEEANNNRRLEADEAGEVCVSGDNVTPGYVGLEDANRKAFFQYDGKRWFRTGDRGTMDGRGRLRLLGRFSEIINRGGEKISPPEVDEAMMLSSSEIKEAACFAVPDEFYGQEIEAAVVIKDGDSSSLEGNQDGVQKLLESRLAGFKIPKRIHFCQGSIPKGPTGKIQRNLLSKRFATQPQSNNSNGTQVNGKAEDGAGVDELIASALRISKDDTDSEKTLLELGADSIVFARLAREFRQAGVNIDIATLFTNPTISTLKSMFNDNRGHSGSRETKQKPFEPIAPFALLQNQSATREEIAKEAGLSLEEIEDAMPLAATQMYLADRLHVAPDSNIVFQRDCIRIRADQYTADEWRDAWVETVKLEPSLRTVLVTQPTLKEWQQVVLTPNAGVARLAWHSLSAQEASKLEEIEAGLRHATKMPTVVFATVPSDKDGSKGAFDFHMMQSHLFTDGPTRQMVLKTFCHVLDGKQEEAEKYAQAQVPWSGMVQASNQQSKKADLAFWRRRSELFWTPLDSSRRATWLHRALEHPQDAEEKVIEAVANAATIQGDWLRLTTALETTLPMVVQASFSMAVSLFLSQSTLAASEPIDRIVYDRVINGRSVVDADDADSIRGFTSGYAPVFSLVALSQASVSEYVQNFAAKRREEEDRMPLTEMHSLARHSIKFSWRLVDEKINAVWAKAVDGSRCTVKYDSPAFFGCFVTASHPSKDQVCLTQAHDQRWHDALKLPPGSLSLQEIVVKVLETLEKRAESVPALTYDALRGAILAAGDNELTTQRQIASPLAGRLSGSLPAVYAKMAAEHPDTPALRFGHSPGQITSYKQILTLAVKMAIELVQRGVRRGDRVAMLLQYHDEQSLACMLGIMLVGAIYVPLDPTYPILRLRYQVETVHAKLILHRQEASTLARKVAKNCSVGLSLSDLQEGTNKSSSDDEHMRLQEFSSKLHEDDPVHVLFTSGSTGKPKASVTTHRQAVEAYKAMSVAYPLRPGDRICIHLSPSFDCVTADVFAAFFAGATVTTSVEACQRDPALLSREIVALEATHSLIPPALIPKIPDESLCGMDVIAVGGEALEPQTSRRVARLGRPRLISVYGLHETGAINVTYDVRQMDRNGEPDEAPVPLGFAIGYNTVYILNPVSQERLPLGAEGEIVLGGPQISSGYWQDAEQTKVKYLPDPYTPYAVGPDEPPAQLYRTGDLGYIRQDGAVMILRRMDQQISHLGMRLEPIEIEDPVLAIPGILSCCLVQHRKEDIASQKLVLFLVVQEFVQMSPSNSSGKATSDDTLVLTGKNEVIDAVVAAVRQRLADRVRALAVPTIYIPLRHMPETPNGKRDRKALSDLADRLAESRMLEAMEVK